MKFQRLGIVFFVTLFMNRIQAQCPSEWLWNAFKMEPNNENVNVSHETIDDDTKEGEHVTYSLILHLSWNRQISSLDFDGYAVYTGVVGEQIDTLRACNLSESGLHYTNKRETEIQIKFNYDYEIRFYLASKELDKKSFLNDGVIQFNGVDCYQETKDRHFCMTQDAQYVSAPIDVRIENITMSQRSHTTWVSMYPPASINSQAALHSYRATIIDSTTQDFLSPEPETLDEVFYDVTEREYFSMTTDLMTQETSYYLTVVAQADINETLLRDSIESIVYFNLSDFLIEEINTNFGHKDTTIESLSIYYTLVIPVLIGAILFATVVIFLGFYTRRQRRKETIPQFKREPDDMFIKSKHDYFEYREVDPLFAKKEFDRDMLKIEEELGSGQFGVVCKGFACGIDGGNDYIPVAVKSLKGHVSRSMKEYFLDEIRLIIDIGSHPNILGILGCCTSDEPYYLITEFMHYGDLFHFLLKCREAKYALEDPIFHLVYQNQVQIARQIARGMDYLSSTRYYHGDLAARNILVDKGLTIKISDFGLADDIYQSDYKHLAPDRKRPIKWVSLETNLQGICTIQSDVWSFGIVLYEISTLGEMPYTGMQSIEVVEKLKEGYRMEQPENCSNEWYQMMLECWAATPSRRPKFSELFSRLDTMLGEDAVDYLLPLDGDTQPILEDDLALGTSAKSYTPVSEDVTTGYEGFEGHLSEGTIGKSVSTDNMVKAVGADSAFYEDIGYT
ncbi:uncharacterized protein [Antedon mediterranea]|uniref:uncharacterized protein n=1 Tax=Antedon mediterranea TaxID=105859 RepID=UPI003AF5876E